VAIAFNSLLSEVLVNSGATSFTTSGSYAPAGNALVLACVHGDAVNSGDDEVPSSLSGNGLTWVNIANVACQANWDNISIWRAMGASPSSGALTVNYTNGQEGCQVHVLEFTGVDTSGTNGSGAVVQSAKTGPSSGTSATVTLAAFGSANNATFGAFGRLNSAVNAATPGTGFTESFDNGNDYGSWAAMMMAEYLLGNDTTVDYSWSGTYNVGGVAIEVKAATSGTDVLLANDVESASEVSSPAVGQKHVILANDIESASEASSPAVGQKHILLADDVESSSEVTTPSVGQEHGLLANDVESASEVTSPAIGQEHALLANDIESASEFSSPAVGQEHALLANDIESASELSTPSITEVPAGTDALLANDIESASQVSVPSLSVIGAATSTGSSGGARYAGRVWAWTPEPKKTTKIRFDTEREERLKKLIEQTLKRKKRQKELERIAKIAAENAHAAQDIHRITDQLERELITMSRLKEISEKKRIEKVHQLREEEDIIVALLLMDI